MLKKKNSIPARPTWKGSALLLFSPLVATLILVALGVVSRQGSPASHVSGLATPALPIPKAMLIAKGAGSDSAATPDASRPEVPSSAKLPQNSPTLKPDLQSHPDRIDQPAAELVSPRLALQAASQSRAANDQPFVGHAENGLSGNGPANGSELVPFDAAIGIDDLAAMEEMGQVALLAFMPNRECWRRWRVADGWTWMRVRDEKSELQGMSNTCIPLILGLAERRTELARAAGADKAAIADIQVGLSSHAVAVIRAAQTLALGPTTSGSPQAGARTIGRLVVANSGEIAFVIDATTGPARR